MHIPLSPVESRDIVAAGYSPSSQVLRIQFKSTGAYDYPNVDQQLAKAFWDSPSKGRFVATILRPSRTARRVAAEELMAPTGPFGPGAGSPRPITSPIVRVEPIPPEENPVPESTSLIYYIPYALHIPVLIPPTSIDGFGNPVTGYQEPQFDTLIGIANPNSQSMTATIRVYGQDGSVKNWGSSSSKQYTLGPGRSVATTFIIGNVFSDAPQNWQGYVTVELSLPGAVYAMLGGGGYFPDHWNTFSAEVPVYVDATHGYDAKVLSRRSEFTFPYSIPYFDDANHTGDRSYRTSMSLTNFDTQDCWAHITFTVAEFYSAGGGAGTQFKAKQLVPAGGQIARILYEWLQEGGYPVGVNFEGWIKVELRTGSSEFDPLVALKVVPYMLVSNRDFNLFSAGGTFL